MPAEVVDVEKVLQFNYRVSFKEKDLLLRGLFYWYKFVLYLRLSEAVSCTTNCEYGLHSCFLS